MSRLLRNGVQLGVSALFFVAFGCAAVAQSSPEAVASPANEASWLGLAVASLWFLTSVVNGVRGNRERKSAGAAPAFVRGDYAPVSDEVKGALADLRQGLRLSDDLNKARFDKHERRMDSFDAHLAKQDETLLGLASAQGETRAGVQELLRLAKEK